MRLEAIAVGEPTVSLSRLPFRPEILQEGGGDVFGIAVSATKASK